jgi:hypothetical protein
MACKRGRNQFFVEFFARRMQEGGAKIEQKQLPAMWINSVDILTDHQKLIPKKSDNWQNYEVCQCLSIKGNSLCQKGALLACSGSKNPDLKQLRVDSAPGGTAERGN